MLKTVSAVGPIASVEIKDKEQDGKRIQMDRDAKELAQKGHKSQQTAKLKMWIRAEKTETSKN